MRFVMQTLGAGKGPMYPNPSPQGGCGTDLLTQNGGHHAAYFSSGCGAIRAERKPAMLWVYNHFVAPHEHKTLPKVAADRRMGQFVFRNRRRTSPGGHN